jgi:hypothetical protein
VRSHKSKWCVIRYRDLGVKYIEILITSGGERRIEDNDE